MGDIPNLTTENISSPFHVFPKLQKKTKTNKQKTTRQKKEHIKPVFYETVT